MALRPVPDGEIPGEVRYRNWITVGEDGRVEGVLDRLVAAIETDLEWEHQHTRLTVKALEWASGGRDASLLVRGAELAAAERWLRAGAQKARGPTALEQEYLIAARNAASRRQRMLMGASTAVAVAAVSLLIFALISRSQAIGARDAARRQAVTARSQALAAESETQLDVDPERSILLASAAVHTEPTTDAMFALRAAIDASPIRYRLPNAGLQMCAGAGVPTVAFSPNGNQIAEGLCNGTVALADAHTGGLIRRVDLGAPAGQVSYSSTSSTLAAWAPFDRAHRSTDRGSERAARGSAGFLRSCSTRSRLCSRTQARPA